MIKCILPALSLVAMLASVAPVFAAKKGGKLVISFQAQGQAQTDCRISKKEIKKSATEPVFVCSQIAAASAPDQEMVPSGLGRIVAMAGEQKGTLAVGFEGTDAESLAELLNKWIEFLASKPQYAAESAGWTASIASSSATEAAVQLSNAQSGASFVVPVSLGVTVE